MSAEFIHSVLSRGPGKRSLKFKASVNPVNKLRNHVAGIDKHLPLLDGKTVQYINFDNAASTPPLKEVLKAIDDFMPWYSSVHRGTGFKSLVATKAYDDARQVVGDFFGADRAKHVVIFVKNSTEAINKLSYRLGLTKDDV